MDDGRYWSIFVRPGQTFARLLEDPRRMRIGVIAMLIMSVLYTLVCVFLARIPGTPNPSPFLRIPSETYFYWASYFYALVLISGWIFGSAVMHLSARMLGGRGNFEDAFALAGFATAAATLCTLLPDLLLTFPQAIGLMDYHAWFYSVTHYGAWFYIIWMYLMLYMIFFCIFYPALARAVYGFNWSRAIIAGLCGFIAYQGFIFLFIR